MQPVGWVCVSRQCKHCISTNQPCKLLHKKQLFGVSLCVLAAAWICVDIVGCVPVLCVAAAGKAKQAQSQKKKATLAF
jgi:hypothetical protein